MRQVLRFLHSLSLHNDKAWFDAHKPDYLKAKDTIEVLAVKLIEGIRSFDDTIGPLNAADCTYRIYRDVRFSKDKSPYKTHMGVFITRGGKKSGYSGYYFHVDGTGDHLLAIGDYLTEPQVLKTLREDIEMGGGDFRRILAGLAPGLVLDTEGALKKVPKGFPADSPDAEFFKLKNFCLLKSLDKDFILSPNLVDSVLDIFRTGKPFLDYINRAIDYCREESLL
ncbi:MAG: DUF2461 domain-containing protein [Bacteroidales bacterium]|nr:DUF2461 domain-containing protein [Bacteroidales bacterium]MBR0291410.1 DUF2461 domain-containing protein [Bacteroidales bacterium]